MKKQIPNIFTLLNLFFGCLAIIFTLQNGITIVYTPDGGGEYVNIPEKIWMASVFIMLAGLVDFLDGLVARLFKATSEMGKQLDSLADVVSFGVAPSMIMYQFLRLSIAKEENGIDSSIVCLLPSVLIACAGAYRLARFNIDTTQQYGFKGVPIPAVGLLIASFPLIYWNCGIEAVTGLLLNKWILYTIIILVSWSMLSTLPMMALKFKGFNLKNDLPKIILVVSAIVAALLLQWLAVPIVFVIYIILSLIFKDRNI